MQRKWIFIGAGVLLILAAIVLVAGRGRLRSEKRSVNDELVLSAEGKLVVQPGERTKSTFVVSENIADKKTNTPPPP